MSKYKAGKITKGTVTGVESYGVFMSFDEYYSGLIHISEISHGFVRSIADFVQVGDVISAKILEVDEGQNHLKLSIKDIEYKKGKKTKRKKIVETTLGFKTLEHNLPIWIEQKLEKSKKN